MLKLQGRYLILCAAIAPATLLRSGAKPQQPRRLKTPRRPDAATNESVFVYVREPIADRTLLISTTFRHAFQALHCGAD